MLNTDRYTILYEADRLCNVGHGGVDGTQGDVSILYEADRLCNGYARWRSPKGQAVSILYEADRLCNQPLVRRPAVLLDVSILYEADRLCNYGRRGPSWSGSTGFNPLRGRQTLQPRPRGVEGAPLPAVSILYEADRLCNLVLGPAVYSAEFQSSTRQTDFATRARAAFTRASSGFNPLRGRQTLQLLRQPEFAMPHGVSILYEADRLCNCPCQEAAPDRGS